MFDHLDLSDVGARLEDTEGLVGDGVWLHVKGLAEYLLSIRATTTQAARRIGPVEWEL